jgi:hypothetical protein
MAEPMDELIPTRATLIQRLKDWQDQSSWQDFFDTYWKLIYGVALKGGLTAAEAQDVVQETMISVAKHMPTFEYDPAIGSFKTWLLNMTRWRITDQLRKRGPFAAGHPAGEDTAPAPVRWTKWSIRPAGIWTRCGTRNGKRTCSMPPWQKSNAGLTRKNIKSSTCM